MTKVVKHVVLPMGCALLLDSGVIEVLGDTIFINELRKQVEYVDNVQDISGYSEAYSVGAIGGLFYRTYDGACGKVEGPTVLNTTLTPYCNIQGVDIRTPHGHILPLLPNFEVPKKCILYMRLHDKYVWECLTVSGKVYHTDTAESQVWVFIPFRMPCVDIFQVNDQCVRLFYNGKLWSGTSTVPDYIELEDPFNVKGS